MACGAFGVVFQSEGGVLPELSVEELLQFLQAHPEHGFAQDVLRNHPDGLFLRYTYAYCHFTAPNNAAVSGREPAFPGVQRGPHDSQHIIE